MFTSGGAAYLKKEKEKEERKGKKGRKEKRKNEGKGLKQANGNHVISLSLCKA